MALKVVFVSDPKRTEPWCQDVSHAVRSHGHSLHIYEYRTDLEPQFKGVDVVIDFGGSWGTHAMADAADSVKLWQILGTGIDHFDLPYWKSKGIPVANCPGTCSGPSLAECAMMYILMLTRRWTQTQENIRAGIPNLPFGEELDGRSIGIIGFGGSGRELARRARGFGMRILAIDVREIPQSEKDNFGIEFIGGPDALDRVIAEVDYLSLHLHLNEKTHHIIDDRRLRLMKPTARIVNVARGALIDEDALYAALSEGRLAGVGLDVFSKEPIDPNHPLLQLPNVVATPHTAGTTDGTSRRRAEFAAMNCDRVAEGQPLLSRVDC
jgi:phosphoglycerate dehydrogenase-like enzyme